jgi:hypothetical protein
MRLTTIDVDRKYAVFVRLSDIARLPVGRERDTVRREVPRDTRERIRIPHPRIRTDRTCKSG